MSDKAGEVFTRCVVHQATSMLHATLLSSKIRTQFMYHSCQDSHSVIVIETSLVTLNFILFFTSTIFRLSFSLVLYFIFLLLCHDKHFW